MIKRLFDILFSTIILILFFPFGFLISVWIYLESGGGIFYKQERVGLNGKQFKILKYRTMLKNSDQLGKLTVGMRDSRITKSGYFLRKFKLDEFPQFLNVLKGEMSIVGPRPEVLEYVKLYTEEQQKILQVKPGITDYASIFYFNENELLGNSKDPEKMYITEVMPAKINLNLKYIEQPGLFQDLKIVWLTALKIFR